MARIVLVAMISFVLTATKLHFIRPALAEAKSAGRTSTEVYATVAGYQVESKSANGLNISTFTTPQGVIKVNLPDDMAAGDTISGTVTEEPNGKNDAERAQNLGALNGYVIEVEGRRTPVADQRFSWSIPRPLNTNSNKISLLQRDQNVATAAIPIATTPPPTPAQFTIPTGGQQGRLIRIKGPCNGIFSSQDSVKVGGTVLPAGCAAATPARSAEQCCRPWLNRPEV